MAKSRTLTAAAIVLGLLALAPGAWATHVQCGDTITQDTTLDSDLSCAGDGLTIGASQITLDLAGHTIEGNGTYLSRGLVIQTVYSEPLELDGIQVRGGTIRGFFYGAEVDGPRETVFDELALERNEGIGIRCHYAPGCRITDSSFQANGTGISLEAVDSGCRPRALIARNLIEGNQRGIRLAGCPTDVVSNRIEENATRSISIEDHGFVVVSRNIVAGNGTDGVYAWYLATVNVIDNRINRNGGDGVHFDGDAGPYAPAGIVRHNRVLRNGGDGIHTTNVWGDTSVDANRTERNGDDGIDVDIGEFGGPISVRANRALFNFDLGIEADPGTFDGGGNRAHGNGNPAQCIGVRCK